MKTIEQEIELIDFNHPITVHFLVTQSNDGEISFDTNSVCIMTDLGILKNDSISKTTFDKILKAINEHIDSNISDLDSAFSEYWKSRESCY